MPSVTDRAKEVLGPPPRGAPMQLPLAHLVLLWVLTASSPWWKGAKTTWIGRRMFESDASKRGLPDPALPRAPSLVRSQSCTQSLGADRLEEGRAQGAGRTEPEQRSS